MAKTRRNTARSEKAEQKKKKNTPKPRKPTSMSTQVGNTNYSVVQALIVRENPNDTTSKSNTTFPANEKPPVQTDSPTNKAMLDTDSQSTTNNNAPAMTSTDHKIKPSFKKALMENLDKEILDGPSQDTFLIHKYLHDSGLSKKQDEAFLETKPAVISYPNSTIGSVRESWLKFPVKTRY